MKLLDAVFFTVMFAILALLPKALTSEAMVTPDAGLRPAAAPGSTVTTEAPVDARRPGGDRERVEGPHGVTGDPSR